MNKARLSGIQNVPLEWSFIPAQKHHDPFNQAEYDVEFSDDQGRIWCVPAFWRGGRKWSVRFSAPQAGTYCFHVAGEPAQGGVLNVKAYRGSNPLFKHGPLTVSDDRRYLQHADGTPFFWLGDTWWLGTSKRIKWPREFTALTADRKKKGFSVIQIVAGLFPDMEPFDPRSRNEKGMAWEKNWTRINPYFYDAMDRKIAHLASAGLVPCIVGGWGYYLMWMGEKKMKRHWRNLIARYGACPVVWCLAGEGVMPFYLSKHKDRDAAAQKDGWTAIARYVRAIDPYHHPVTIHPTDTARSQVNDDSVLDFDMLQTGHSGYASVENTLRLVAAGRARTPRMPVIDGEVNYEGIFGASKDDVQRLMFWQCLLSGAAGHTYGANGIFQFDRPGDLFGPSPHGACWSVTPWQEACRLPGARQAGIGRRILERYAWWRFRPHQEWIEPAAAPGEAFKNYAAGIPGQVRVIYLTHTGVPWSKPIIVRNLERSVPYRASWVDPVNGKEYRIGRVRPDRQGVWRVPYAPSVSDWLLVLEKCA